jgi:hypothetical protein
LRNVISWVLVTSPIPNYVVLILGNLVLVIGNEGGVLIVMEGHHTWGLGIGLRKLVALTLNIHQIFNRAYIVCVCVCV